GEPRSLSMITRDDQAKWDDERRWVYARGVLSLDAVGRLLPWTGIPFQGDRLLSFRVLLRDYLRSGYLASDAPQDEFPARRDRLLARIETAFGRAVRDEYAIWVRDVFVFLPREHTPGWSEWLSIFMRCSVRAGWWERLGLPTEKAEPLFLDLEDAKARIDDARELRDSLKGEARSEWDCRVMDWLDMTDERVESGEPFCSIVLTVTFFQFYIFWRHMADELS